MNFSLARIGTWRRFTPVTNPASSLARKKLCRNEVHPLSNQMIWVIVHVSELRRKPNISKLVYKFLSLERGRGQQIGETLQNYIGPKCSICKRFKRREEASNSQDSQPGGNMANKRKESARNSKIHRVKRRQTSRDQTLSSCMHKGSGGEGKRKWK